MEILEAFEKGELKRVANAMQEIELHKAIADATFKQDVDVNPCLAVGHDRRTPKGFKPLAGG
ncbi:MAG: hypothetical protein DM484_25890 [Candidatus Methylumidiphilus alinenensis]|uniref:Uncharacterized protein n=1 Tax=Candidatus Methylumidiphilus alinenensis TaxID=2202197 RepID=A0A2W4QI63_9GAMM|nr:MAG: hypothetical protein DM484_25890 [Candidatus Methylumidiphilus alinenensis]